MGTGGNGRGTGTGGWERAGMDRGRERAGGNGREWTGRRERAGGRTGTDGRAGRDGRAGTGGRAGHQSGPALRLSPSQVCERGARPSSQPQPSVRTGGPPFVSAPAKCANGGPFVSGSQPHPSVRSVAVGGSGPVDPERASGMTSCLRSWTLLVNRRFARRIAAAWASMRPAGHAHMKSGQAAGRGRGAAWGAARTSTS